MATIHLYLDKRSLNTDGEAQIKIGINKQGSSAYIPLHIKVLPSQWDAQKERVKDHTNKLTINNFIQSRKTEILNIIIDLTNKGELTKLTATQIKNKVQEILQPSLNKDNTFLSRLKSYASSRTAPSTKEKYWQTIKRILEYDKRAKSLAFEDITKDWLNGFDFFLSQYNKSKNGRNIHFRNIRAVFNDAIDNDITTCYPFRKFKIRPEATPKRSLSVNKLRGLFNYNVEPYQQRYLDMFKLSFFLIGINVTDLCLLSEISEDGYIEYRRAKTKRMYRIKVEPEALAIINKYRGRNQLLNLMDGISKPKTFTLKFDRALKEIGQSTMEHNPVWKPKTQKHRYIKVHHSAFPNLTSYWARHTWATIAAELDIPSETISAALGHSITNKTTAIYIDFNRRKIDEANRRVIDYVLYNKK